MKQILIFLFLLASLSASAQITLMGGMGSRVNDSTTYVTSTAVTNAHSNGYHDIWLSNTSNLWWVWDGSQYVNWDPTASGSGGATAAGSTGNVQYKSAGGGLQAEAAFSYDSATNLLTVPAITHGSATALSDGASISITAAKCTLTTTQATITFSDSWVGDFTTISVTFTQTSAVWTFPAGALCVVEGTASGDNTATISGTSGDKMVISIWDIDGTNYRVVIKNFGQ